MYPNAPPDYSGLWAVVAAVWVACAIAGGYVGRSKGREAQGLFLGLLLGVIGLVAIAAMAPSEPARAEDTMYRECPHCKERMRRDANVCPQCRHESPAWTQRATSHRVVVDGCDVGAAQILRDHQDGGAIRLTQPLTSGSPILVAPQAHRVTAVSAVDVIFVQESGAVAEVHRATVSAVMSDRRRSINVVIGPSGWLDANGIAAAETVFVLSPGELGPS
jgi:hypothetical protein